MKALRRKQPGIRGSCIMQRLNRGSRLLRDHRSRPSHFDSLIPSPGRSFFLQMDRRPGFLSLNKLSVAASAPSEKRLNLKEPLFPCYLRQGTLVILKTINLLSRDNAESSLKISHRPAILLHIVIVKRGRRSAGSHSNHDIRVFIC